MHTVSITAFICVWLEAGYDIPSFSGRSFIQLRSLDYGARDVTIEIQFQPQRPDGLLLYAGNSNGSSGDFLSLALNRGFVEFRSDW